MTGQPADISVICVFGWYNWCYYQDPDNMFPNPVELLGRVLGPVEHAGTEMSQWVMNENGTFLP